MLGVFDPVVDQVEKWVFDDLLQGSGWTKEAGPVEGVFITKLAGHRCLWSCNWITWDGLLIPDDYLLLESMPVEMLVWEGRDLVDRVSTSLAIEAARLLIKHNAGDVLDALVWEKDLIGVIQDARRAYPEFVCPWSLPNPNFVKPSTSRPTW
jgi:hypothetical protein